MTMNSVPARAFGIGGATVTVSASHTADAVSFTISASGLGGSRTELLIQPDPLLANPNYTVELFHPSGKLTPLAAAER